MHTHFCEVVGHEWQCGDDCICICGLPMEGHDHSDCPVELRPCPEHKAEQEQRMVEAMFSNADTVSATNAEELEAALPHCNCGCAEAERSKVVGWCFWCDHTYTDFKPETEDWHFAHDCPEAPEELKQAALARLEKGSA